jgi:hypothetical protein
MNTKVLMSTSAVILALAGVSLTFFPQEIGENMGMATSGFTAPVLQIMGALYFAFGMINWTARANLIGGIYGRPIAIGNLTHFTIGALTLLKAMSSTSIVSVASCIIYILFAIAFGVVFFRHPIKSGGE